MLLDVPVTFVALVDPVRFNCRRPASPTTEGEDIANSSLDPVCANFERVFKYGVEDFWRVVRSGEARLGP